MLYSNGTVGAAFKMNCTNRIRPNITYYRLQCVHWILKLCSNDIIIIVMKVLPKYNRFQTQSNLEISIPCSRMRGERRVLVVSDEIKLEGIIYIK
jgi:hypothetical protein